MYNQALMNTTMRELSGDVEDELIFYDHILTWRDVANAIRAYELLKYTRRQTKMPRRSSASTSRKEKEK
ncbi:hypothetical protein CR513_29552, partial [Mucuna pruriens]